VLLSFDGKRRFTSAGHKEREMRQDNKKGEDKKKLEPGAVCHVFGQLNVWDFAA
jgi:hypothetical protein